jgi:hypothetical protein
MRRIVCIGCGFAEDMNNPTGNIHRMKLVDLTPRPEAMGAESKADLPIEEDLCQTCRKKLRSEFFGESDAGLMDMPLMRGA